MSGDDKLAILEVIARYSHAYDDRDADGFAELFLEDGVFEVFAPGQNTASLHLESRAAIHEWASRRLRARRGRFVSRHYQSGTVFDELTLDAARTRTMLLVTHQGVAAAPESVSPPAPEPTLSGIYRDRWQKTPAGWRFAHRAAYVDRDPGTALH